MDIITHATSETSETKQKSRTYRRFVTTIYGKDGDIPTPPDWDQIKQKISYFAYAHEICPKTKRPHLQCYGYCKTPMRTLGIVKILRRPENSHNNVEEMKATFDQNEAYCSKQGELVELGVLPAQGTRNDLISVKRAIDNGNVADLTVVRSHWIKACRASHERVCRRASCTVNSLELY